MKLFKTFYRISYGVILLVIGFSIFSNLWVIYTTHKAIHDSIEDLSFSDVGLVLGTSKKMIGGQPNPYFTFRMEAAAELYHQGKVKHLILSGDNREKYYNEPSDMKKALIALGVPEEDMTLDYAGLRTLDSVIRSKEIFGQKKVTIITQRFHSYRAVFISNFYKVETQAFVAKNIGVDKGFPVLFREYLARPKAVLDLYFLGVPPGVIDNFEINDN
jgi:SanA protein